jgi:hypothetical protein
MEPIWLSGAFFVSLYSIVYGINPYIGLYLTIPFDKSGPAFCQFSLALLSLINPDIFQGLTPILYYTVLFILSTYNLIRDSKSCSDL